MLDFSLIKYIVLTNAEDKYNNIKTYIHTEDLERAYYEAEAHIGAYSGTPNVKATAFIFEVNLIKVLEEVENAED